MRDLAEYASLLAGPELERPYFWRALVGWNRWALILITRGKPGEPPERPGHWPAARISPEWLRRTGRDLTPEQLVHERIGQHLRANVQHDAEVDVARAASIATDAVISVLAELGVTLPDTQAERTDR